jgi:Dehydratase medium subunit.
MDSNHPAPAIVITAFDGCISSWNDVLLGIEEEGIPFAIRDSFSGDVIQSAWQAACQSPLLVGIACDKQTLVVHYKNLPTSAPLFTLTYQQNSHAQRSIGNNAARLVKGIPFRECHSLSTGEMQYE